MICRSLFPAASCAAASSSALHHRCCTSASYCSSSSTTAMLSSTFRYCASSGGGNPSSSSNTTTSANTSSSSPSSSSAAANISSTSSSSSNETVSSTTPPPPSSGMKMTHIGQAEWLAADQFDKDKPWCSAPTLYRRLLKLYIRKFKDHVPIIIRAWKQTKLEFVHFRNAAPEDVPALINRGRLIHNAVQGGIIPVVKDEKTGLTYCKYDKETLIASGGMIDPISAEEFLRRHHDKLSEAERNEIRDKLKASGRWRGPNEFSEEDVPKLKVKKRKVKCTDPDE